MIETIVVGPGETFFGVSVKRVWAGAGAGVYPIIGKLF